MANEATAMSTALKFTPKPSERRSCFIDAPPLVRTVKMPITERIIPTAAISMGASTAFICTSGLNMKAAEPSAAVARMEPQ